MGIWAVPERLYKHECEYTSMYAFVPCYKVHIPRQGKFIIRLTPRGPTNVSYPTFANATKCQL